MAEAQQWSAERYVRDAGFVATLGAGVAEWLAPLPAERILDLGCGDGALTVDLAAAGATVVGGDARAAAAAEGAGGPAGAERGRRIPQGGPRSARAMRNERLRKPTRLPRCARTRRQLRLQTRCYLRPISCGFPNWFCGPVSTGTKERSMPRRRNWKKR